MKIKIDMNMCIGCRRCELACSLNHYEKNAVNPKKARIRVWEQGDDIYPVMSGPFNTEECTSQFEMQIGDKTYDGCSICRASCADRTWFKEPDTQILLRCDLCGDPPDPQCVRWCPCNAIVLLDDDEEIIPCTLENM